MTFDPFGPEATERRKRHNEAFKAWWDTALPEARKAYMDDLNRRADDQTTSLAKISKGLRVDPVLDDLNFPSIDKNHI